MWPWRQSSLVFWLWRTSRWGLGFLVSTQVGTVLGAFLGARVAALARVVRLVVLGVLLLAAANLLAP